MLITLLYNKRRHRESYTSIDTDIDTITKRVFIVIAIVYYTRAKKRSNSFYSMLYVYLYSSSTKQRVIECLLGLRVYLSYYRRARIIKAIIEDAKVYILYYY